MLFANRRSEIVKVIIGSIAFMIFLAIIYNLFRFFTVSDDDYI